MRARRVLLIVGGVVAAMVLLPALGWVAYSALAWMAYGSVERRGPQDPMLDRYMPRYEVAEVLQTRTEAPASITFAVAAETDLHRSRMVHGIFRGREILFRSKDTARVARPFLREVLAIGWGVLVEEPGREIVVGAVTQPWKGDVKFTAVAPAAFAAFNEPDQVKFVWNMAVDSIGR